jgi:DNA-binding NtrC family response regulator
MKDTLKVLLVDDEKMVGDRLKPALTKIGYSVEALMDPQKALRRIDESEFDIIVTDIMMEDVDGIQILEAAMKKSHRTRVIVITGYANVNLAREAMDKGAFDIIEKPFRPGDLRNVIANAAKALDIQREIGHQLPPN